jgi:hypothetical protein
MTDRRIFSAMPSVARRRRHRHGLTLALVRQPSVDAGQFVK